MALNPNHTFEDIGTVKCSIVEKNCTPERTDFLKRLLEHNGYTVIIANSPPPKTAAPATPKPPEPAADGSVPEAPPAPQPVTPELPPPPATFTIGVTDLTFNMVNEVFNRNLKTFEGTVLTSAYWKQQERVTKPEEWYWQK